MASAPFGSRSYLVDNSVYARASDPRVATVWTDALRADRLVSCGPFVIEALYSARDAGELEALLEELTDGMRCLEITDATWRMAYTAQRRMAEVAPQFHRRPPIDYLVAAAAHEHELGVLHYDSDYDDIARHSGLTFESRWVAERGSLGHSTADALRPLRRGINARLAQFSGDQAVLVYTRVVDLLDEAIAAAGKAALPPPTQRVAPGAETTQDLT